jgi:outer membrane protein assembly factor BamD
MPDNHLMLFSSWFTRNRFQPIRRMVMVMGLCGLVFGCSSSDDADLAAQNEQPVDELYNDALNTVLAGDVDLAAPKFEEVERQHPYSIWAVRAQIMAAWSFYQSNQYVEAEGSLNRFIELYPADPLTEYAYYLKALTYYEQIVDVERDADMTYKALTAFEDVLRRYPDGPYARDSQLKADLTRSHLAGKEMAVGRFYLKKGFYAAAIKRFAVVVRDYDQTNQVPEALYRMAEAYLSLSLSEEASRVRRVAEFNYPDSIWTKRLVEVTDNPSRTGPQGVLKSIADRALSLF